MQILIAGGTGFLGNALIQELIRTDNNISVLTRYPRKHQNHQRLSYFSWDGKTLGDWLALVESSDCVINLTGENLGNKRWRRIQKEKIIGSRVDSGNVLTHAISMVKHKPKVFIQPSGIGYYGSSVEGELNESSPPGDDFLAQICRQWEASSQGIEALGVRRVVIRIGVVLSRNEGALKRLLLPYYFFLGGPLGSGKQVLSWIHLSDVVQGIIKIMKYPSFNGVYNFVAPKPATNEEIGRTIARILKRPYWLPIPSIFLKILFGEMSTLVIDGQYAIPDKLMASNYHFKFSNIDDALKEILS
ncbi:TIGR01777 family oxidoreductase [Chloroflexota bacterium]